MIRLQFKIEINDTVDKVSDAMLGLSDRSTYEHWTSAFNPGSTYEGSWNENSRIWFVGTDPNGEKGGMVSEIAAHIPGQFVSIRHIGILKGDNEMLEGPDVDEWKGSLENYTFEFSAGVTTVTVDLDTADAFKEYMQETYPIALKKLKDMCESD